MKLQRIRSKTSQRKKLIFYQIYCSVADVVTATQFGKFMAILLLKNKIEFFFRCLIRLYLTICDDMDMASNKPQSPEVTLNEPHLPRHHNRDTEEPMEEDFKLECHSNSPRNIMQAAIDCVKQAYQVVWWPFSILYP